MSWFRCLRKLAPSGTCAWWWIPSVAWTEATPLSLSALKKLHSRLSNWYVYCKYNQKKERVWCNLLTKTQLNSTFLFLLLFTISSIIRQCNNNEIRPGKHIGVCISVANNRLFVGSIPKSKTKDQIVEEFAKVTGEWAPSLDFSFHIIFCVISIQQLHAYIYIYIHNFEVDEALTVCLKHFLFVSKWWPHYHAAVTYVTMMIYR